MKKIFFALLMLSIFANIPSDVFSWSGTPSSSVNLANSAGAAATPKQNLAKGEAGGGGSVPVGTIIAWPVATNPSDADKWLECKGQTITQAAYPELYAVVGGRVPDYQGMFLRGYGSQTSSHYGSVTHSSDGLGIIQGDAIRNAIGTLGDTLGPWNISGIVRNRGMAPNWVAGAYNWSTGSVEINFSLALPTSNENRPVNKAVRYLIRAKS